MFLDRAQVLGQIAREARQSGVAAEFGEAGERLVLDGQPLRLLVGLHLQAMLDGAQEDIGAGQFVDRLLRPPSPRAKARASMASVRAPRSAGRRPPKISCCVCTKNSISRMPPRPSLTSWPATATSSWPRTAWIWRFIAWMSAMAA